MKLLRIGQIVKVLHYEDKKVTDSVQFYLDDLSCYNKKHSISKADWLLVKSSPKYKPKIIIDENEVFKIKNGKAFGYFVPILSWNYPNRAKITHAYIRKVISPISLRNRRNVD